MVVKITSMAFHARKTVHTLLWNLSDLSPRVRIKLTGSPSTHGLDLSRFLRFQVRTCCISNMEQLILRPEEPASASPTETRIGSLSLSRPSVPCLASPRHRPRSASGLSASKLS